MTTVKGTQNATSKVEILKWALAIALFMGGVVANSHFVEVAAPVRVLAWLVLCGLVVTVIAYTTAGRSAWSFARESRVEMRKVVWPTRQETIQTTTVVAVLVVIVAAFLWMIDSGLLVLIGWLTGQRG